MFTYYANPGIYTQFDDRFAELPNDVADLCHAVQGLLLHPQEAQHYGVRLTRARWKELALRDVLAKLRRIDELAPGPLDQARPPDKRLLGNCRDFAVMLCAVLRAHAIPARVRYGFAEYFHPNFLTDHVVCEYWNGQRWIRVDALLDEVLQQVYAMHLNPLDLAASEFLCAGAAWQGYQAGQIAAARVGLKPTGPTGHTFICEGILHDIASLNKMEPLCQDDYLLDAGRDTERQWDQLATWTVNPDQATRQLRAAFQRLSGGATLSRHSAS